MSLGKVALITGAASGFGAEVARQLVRRGDRVILLDVNDADGQAVADELGATYLHCDVSSYQEVLATTAQAEQVHGGIDLFFLNAGISTGCDVGAGFDPAAYRRAMGINVDGVVFGAHAADLGLPDARLAASIAKSKASDVAGDAVGAMIQFHGGIGYTWEHDTHFYFKRAKRLQYAYGDAIQHRERIASLLLDTVTAPAETVGA